MQVNPILNLLVPTAAGGQASPLNSLAGQAGVGGFFTGLLGEQVGMADTQGLDAASLMESLNPESGGIVPVPLVSDTVPPILQGAGLAQLSALEAKLQYVSQREGRVPAEVIAGLGNKDAASQLSGQNVGTAMPNELMNDEDYQLSVKELVYGSVNKDEKGINLALSNVAAGANKTPVEVLNQLKEKFAVKPPVHTSDAKVAADAPDEYITVKDLSQLGKGDGDVNKNITQLASLLTGAGTQAKINTGFATDAIDANEELLSTQKFRPMHDSKLEMQAKLLEQQTQNPQFKSAADQVTVKITQAVAEGMDKIRIKLHPAELGKVAVEMDVRDDGKTHVKIIADKSETLELLRRDHADLSRALREVGMKADSGSLEFSLRGEGGGQEFGDTKSGSNSNGQNGGEEESADFSSIDEYIKYGSLNEQELVINISQQGLNIVA